MAQKKVVIVLPKLTTGGTERAAVELANHLSKKNVRVCLILMYKQPIFFNVSPLIDVIEPRSEYRNRLGRILYIPYLLYYLRKKITSEKPDVIFCIGYILLGLISSLGLQSRLIISWRSSPSRVRFPGNALANKVYKFMHYLARGRVDGIIAQTNAAKDVYKDSYNCPITVIPNFLRPVNPFPGHKKEKNIITVGRCVPEKAQHYLIEAFAQINRESWNLIVLGDGPERAKLESQAVRLGVRRRIHFLGFQENVDYYLSQSSIFALTSIIEGYPNALIEAMANGLASVSFDCNAGPSDIIIHGHNGYLVEVGDVNSFSKHLEILIDDEQLRDKIQKNALKVNEINNLESVCEAYEKFLFDS